MDQIPPKLKAFIISHLRRIGYRAVNRAPAFKRANKGRAQWECEQCKKIYTSAKDLHGDHTVPVIDPEIGFTNWDDYINKLFLGEMQAICRDVCHKEKTRSENERRVEKRRAKRTGNKV